MTILQSYRNVARLLGIWCKDIESNQAGEVDYIKLAITKLLLSTLMTVSPFLHIIQWEDGIIKEKEHGHCPQSHVVVTEFGHGSKCKTTPTFSVSTSSLAHWSLYALSALGGQDRWISLRAGN